MGPQEGGEVSTPLQNRDTTRYSRQAGGAHPTGKLSFDICSYSSLKWIYKLSKIFVRTSLTLFEWFFLNISSIQLEEANGKKI